MIQTLVNEGIRSGFVLTGSSLSAAADAVILRVTTDPCW